MFFFRQLQESESKTFTYIVACEKTKKAVIIDPVKEEMVKYSDIIERYGLELELCLDTHCHADHISANGDLRRKFNCKVAMSNDAGVENADIYLNDEQIIEIGSLKFKCITTPGHTNGDMCFLLEDRLFSGDSLMIGLCGRTDFQQGSAENLWNNIKTKIFTLPDETLVYPGHDYKNQFVSSIIQEKLTNTRLKQDNTLEQFINIMNNLNLSYPKKIDVALPVNLKCDS